MPGRVGGGGGPSSSSAVAAANAAPAMAAMREEAAHSKGPGSFKFMWLKAKNIHFLKILFLFQCISITLGIFARIGFAHDLLSL